MSVRGSGMRKEVYCSSSRALCAQRAGAVGNELEANEMEYRLQIISMEYKDRIMNTRQQIYNIQWVIHRLEKEIQKERTQRIMWIREQTEKAAQSKQQRQAEANRYMVPN